MGDRTNLTGGIRYTEEDRTIEAVDERFLPNGALFPPASAVVPERSVSVDKVTWRIALDHQIMDDVMVYASYNTGFKSGGFNASTVTGPGSEPFAPETLDAYEVGVKSELFGNTVRFNVGGFYYDYGSIQLSRFIPGATVFYSGPNAEVYGVDIELEALVTDGLMVSGGVNLLDSKFKSYDPAVTPVVFTVFDPVNGGNNVIQDTTPGGQAAGNELPNAPNFTFNIAAQYTTQVGNGDLSFNVNFSYNDGFFYNADNAYSEPSYGLLNASIGYEFDSGLRFSIWGRNLTDEYVAHTITTSVNTAAAVYRPPLTYGATIGYSF